MTEAQQHEAALRQKSIMETRALLLEAVLRMDAYKMPMPADWRLMAYYLGMEGSPAMTKSKTSGDNQRKGAVKTRSQIKNPITGSWSKRTDRSGKFMDVRADPKPFKGVRKDKQR